MKVISVNVGQPTAIQVGNRSSVSGIRKHAVPGHVHIGLEGLSGDHILNHKHHGGPDQAVYVYTREDYDAWEDVLGRSLAPGTFGENMLISGLESAQVRIGERLGLGDALIEVSSVRIPCGTLGARMGDAGFVKRFVQMRRPGFYARVIQPGDVERGDEVARQPAPPEAPTVGEVFDLWYAQDRDPARLEALLTFPVASRLKAKVHEWLGRSLDRS